MNIQQLNIELEHQLCNIKQDFAKFKQYIQRQLEQLEHNLQQLIDQLYPKDRTLKILSEQINQGSVEDQQIFNNLATEMNAIINPELIKEMTKLGNLLKANYFKCQKGLKQALSIRIENIRGDSLKFHTDLKFETISINKDEETIVQDESTRHYSFACVDHVFNNEGDEQQVKFKILKATGDIGIGVCEMDTLKAKSFRPFLSNIGNGSYICFQDTYTVHATDETMNWMQKGMNFTTGDKITIKFIPKHKKIVWIKGDHNNSSKQIEMTYLDNTKEFRAVAVVKTQGSKVQILNEIPK